MESIKYSDLVIDDGAIQKLIGELGTLRQTYERDVQAIVAACQQMKAEINGLGSGSGGGAGKALAQQMGEIDRLKAKYDELKRRYEQNDLAIEQYKARIAELRQEMKAEAKAQLETTAATRQAEESYNRLAALYTRLKIELNKYSQEEISNNRVLLDKQKQAEATMEKMKALQAATGRHTLDVGNYSKALNGLGLATQQIVREAPSLAMSFNQFFLAISNNLPIFTDAFKRVKEEMGSTKTALMQTFQSLVSWQTMMVVGITVLSKYGNEIIDFVKSLNTAKVAQERLVRTEAMVAEQRAKIAGDIAKSYSEQIAELRVYISVAGNAESTQQSQAAALALVNKQWKEQIEYLGMTITTTEDLLANKEALLRLLVEQAEVQGKLNSITRLSGEIAERESGAERVKLVGELGKAQQEYDKFVEKLGKSGSAAPGAAFDKLFRLKKIQEATDALADFDAETKSMKVTLEEMMRNADALDLSKIFGSGGGGGGKDVRNRDLEFIRAAQDAALEASQDSIFKETETIRLEYTRRIDDLRTYLAEQRALKEDEREITLAGEQAILNQIKSLNLIMDKEIADAWFEMLDSQVGDLTRTLDAETNAFAKALDDMDKKALKSSLGKTAWGDKTAEKRLQQRYQQRRSEIRLETYGDKDAQTSQLRGAEIEYKEGLLEIWQRDATKTTWEVETLRNEIALLKKEASEDEEETWFEKLEKKLEDKLGKKGLTKITKAVTQTVNYVFEQFQAIAQARVELADTMVEQSERELDAAKSTLDQEIEARNNGYANNVALAQQEYLEKQRINEQALAEQEAATEAQEKLNTVQQVMSLITASANIFSSLATIPFGAGIPIAIGLIATMFGAFAAAKIQAAQVTAQTYGQGGTELLSGGSHQSGRDIPLGTMPDGRERRAEGGEYLAIINKRSSRKYGSLVPAVVDALNAGVFEQKYGNAFRGDGGLEISVDGSTDAIERFHDDMKKAMGRSTETRLADGTRVVTYGHTRKIIRS